MDKLDIVVVLTDGIDVLATRHISNMEELEELNKHAKYASDGNFQWCIEQVDEI